MVNPPAEPSICGLQNADTELVDGVVQPPGNVPDQVGFSFPLGLLALVGMGYVFRRQEATRRRLDILLRRSLLIGQLALR